MAWKHIPLWFYAWKPSHYSQLIVEQWLDTRFSGEMVSECWNWGYIIGSLGQRAIDGVEEETNRQIYMYSKNDFSFCEMLRVKTNQN